ncbi:MAG: dehalogenase [Chloroflexota bacterium]
MSVNLWLILGAVVGIGFFLAATKMKLTWYEWVLAVLGTILILFAVQNYSASRLALETRAAGLLLLMFGLPGALLAAAGFVLPWMRARKAA